MFDVVVGQAVRTYRLTHSLTQEEFGTLVGASGQAVSKWERNLNFPDICLLPVIARILGVHVDTFFVQAEK